MISAYWKHVLSAVVALFLLGCHLIAQTPGFMTALSVVMGTMLITLFIKRHFSPTVILWPFVLLALAVVIDRMLVCSVLWNQGDHAAMARFWQGLIEPTVLFCLIWLLLAPNVGYVLPVLVLLSGLPFSTSDFAWALLPLVALTILAPVARPCTRREDIGLLVAVAVLLHVLVRSPCFTTDDSTVTLLMLFLAGYWIGGASTAHHRIVALIALALFAPVVLGFAWSLLFGRLPLSHMAWGINPNIVSAQGGLGLLLLFLLFHRRFRRFSWGILCLGIIILLPFGSIWTVVCLILISGVSLIRKDRLRSMGIWGIAALPFLTLFLLVIPAHVFPERVAVSLLARQFHWRSALGFLVHHPLGQGFGLVHPKALYFAEPADQLASIPGSLMQHAHHFLLHFSEQAGWFAVLMPVVFLIPWLRRFSRLPTDSLQWTAGAGFLFAWASNAADLSVLSLPFVLATGMLLSMATAQKEPPRRGILGQCSTLVLVVLGCTIWFSAIVAFGATERLRQGHVADAERLATLSLRRWPLAPASFDVVEELKTAHPLLMKARDDSLCPVTVPRKVKAATALLSRGRPRQAESLLRSACRLDPRGVLQNGGSEARVFLAMMAAERGNTHRSDSILAGLDWKDARQTEIAQKVDYYLLRGRIRKARGVVLRFMPRTPEEERLKRLLRADVNRQQQRGETTQQQGSVDRVEQLSRQIEFFLAAGRVSQAEAAYEAAQPWLGDTWEAFLMQSKLAVARGDIDRAIAAASQAVAESGGAIHARWELVRVLSHGNRTEEAHRQARLVVEGAPENGEAWLLLAQTLLDLGRASEAKRALDNATHFGADDLSVGIATAQSLRMMGRSDHARSMLVRLARENDSSTWPLWQLAAWAEEEGDLLEAIKWGTAGLRRDPDDPGCNVIVGRAFRKRGRAKQAMTYLTRVSGDRNASHGWRADADEELELLKQQLGRGKK